VSAEILRLNDYRIDDVTIDDVTIDDVADGAIDLATAVDVAIRDFHEILSCWGSEAARQRAEECDSMLRRAFSRHITSEPAA
jgi:hypothetical protein